MARKSNLIGENKGYVPSSILYAELSDAAEKDGADYEELENIRKNILSLGTCFENDVAKVIRSGIAECLIRKRSQRSKIY